MVTLFEKVQALQPDGRGHAAIFAIADAGVAGAVGSAHLAHLVATGHPLDWDAVASTRR